jgi:hypothetical protein
MLTTENYDTRRLERIEVVLDRLTWALEQAKAPDMKAMWATKVYEYQRFSRREAENGV